MLLQANNKLKVAYITTSFSSLSHTFIRREVDALREQGVEIGLFGVRPDKSATEWDCSTSFLYPFSLAQTVKALLKILIEKPKEFFKAFYFALLNEERNPYQHLKLVYHFFLSLPHAEKIITNKYNHIHAHFINVPTTIAMYCSLLSGAPFSFTCHSAGETEKSEVIGLKQKFKMAKFIRVIANFVRQDLGNLIVGKSNIHLIRCGIKFPDLEVVHAKESKSLSTILAVGRMVEKKGFTYLIEALDLLLKSGAQTRLILVGDGPELLKLQELACKKGISSQIDFLLSKSPSEVEALMALVDVVVVPSVTARSGEKEGLPTVIVEAMRAGVPVVATEHSGIPEIVTNQVTGLMVKEKDSAALAEAISRMLTDCKLREKVVPEAYKQVKELFNIDLTIKNLVELFRNSQ